jgi:hypothetical protein
MNTPNPNPDRHQAPIPAAVLAARANSEALQQQYIDSLNPQAPEPVITPPDNLPPAVGDPPVALTPVVEPPVVDDWENRYKAMKGRYDKEVPRFREQIDTMATTITELRTAVATLQARGPAPVDPVHTPKPKTLVTDKEREDFGDEFLGVVEKKVREYTEPLLDIITNLETQLSGVREQTTTTVRSALDKKITELVPNWVEINANYETNGFKEWLALPDPYSGDIRHELLNKAYAQNEAARVAQFFKGFLAEEAATTPQPAGLPQGDPPAPIDLTALAAPGRAKSAAPVTPAEKPFITTAQIQQFYRDVTSGAYKGRDAQRQADELAIFEAQKEGRVR